MSNGRVILNDVELIVVRVYLEQMYKRTTNKETAVMKIIKAVIDKLSGDGVE